MDTITIIITAAVITLTAIVYAILSHIEIGYHRTRAKNLADSLRSVTTDAPGPRRRTYHCCYNKATRILRVYARVSELTPAGTTPPDVIIFEGEVPDAATAIATGNKIVAALLPS